MKPISYRFVEPIARETVRLIPRSGRCRRECLAGITDALHTGFQSLQVRTKAKDTDSDRETAVQIGGCQEHLAGSVDLGQELLV